MKITISILFTLIASNFAVAGEKVKIATEGVYPPFSFIVSGELTGFDVDIANALCEKVQIECEVITQEWDGMIPGLLAAKYDVIVASMGITEERKQKVNFSAPYYKTPSNFMAQKEFKVTDTSPSALAGKAVGVQGSTPQFNLLETKYPGTDIKVYNTVDDASADLAAGRLDFVLSDKVLLDAWLKKSSDGPCCELVGEDLFDPLLGLGKGIAFRMEDTELRDKFDQAIKDIRADGTYEKINNKYFPFSIY